MSIKMLIFDYKNAEHKFFKKNKLEDFDITFFEESLNETTVNNLPEEILSKTSVISIFITSKINEKVLEKFPNLMILSTRSTGINHINLDDCCNRRIKVLNVENYGNKSVVQYTFGLIIALSRKFQTAINDIKAFRFEYNKYVGRELDKLTLGVIGTGAIGEGVCKIAKAFGMNVLAYDVRHKTNLIENYEVKYTDKETLLKNADIITLHAPLTEQTREMITKREFALMKHTAYLINTSRGELINTEDLYNAIISENIAGAGLDVIECEDISFSQNNNLVTKIETSNINCIEKVVLTRKLAQLDNVIITPHIAYSTQDSIDTILETTFDSIKDCLQGGHTNQIN